MQGRRHRRSQSEQFGHDWYSQNLDGEDFEIDEIIEPQNNNTDDNVGSLQRIMEDSEAVLDDVNASKAEQDVDVRTSKGNQGRRQGVAKDDKRMKRILANRESAQRSRARKLKYTDDLEKTVQCIDNDIQLVEQLIPQLKDRLVMAKIKATSTIKQCQRSKAQLQQTLQYHKDLHAAIKELKWHGDSLHSPMEYA